MPLPLSFDSRQCLTTFPNISKFVKSNVLCFLFSTLFSVIGNVVKHVLSCLIYYVQNMWLRIVKPHACTCSTIIFLVVFYLFFNVIIIFYTQLLALERERTQKWVKMVKNWEKYIRGEKVKPILTQP